MQFQLNYNTRALLPAENVTEIITISEREILPVPQMPDCVMGIYSWRSEILWIIDLRNLLGFLKTEDGETLDSPSQASLIRVTKNYDKVGQSWTKCPIILALF